MSKRLLNRIFKFILLLLGIWLGFDLLSHLAAEVLWFREVKYLPEFLLRLGTQLGLWIFTCVTSVLFIFGNLNIADRLEHSHQGWDYKRIIKGGEKRLRISSSQLESSIPFKGLKLRYLVSAILILSLLVGIVLIYYGQQALYLWYPNLKLPSISRELPSWLKSVFPTWELQQLDVPTWEFGLLLVLTFAVVVNYQFWLKAIALLISLVLGFIVSARWDKILQYFHATSFNRTEPLFNQDVSFYVFSLPVWELLSTWFFGLFLFSIAAVALIYLRSANSLSEGRFPGFSPSQRLHLDILAALLMLAVAVLYWLLRYQLLYSTLGVNYGASYTDVKVLLPIYKGLTILAIGVALYLLMRIVPLSQAAKAHLKPTPYPRQLVYVLGLFLVVAILGGPILSNLVQRFIVQPNELTRETPFIDRTIALTREAFNLYKIEARTFNPQATLSAADLQKNDLTIRNIRLWDTRPLLDSNRQLQQIRPYYKFPGADIDRYTLKTELNSSRTENQQTIIAARELDYGDVPKQAQTWVNEHLIYTHGYGFTLSPVNTVGPGGLPDYYVKDIGVENNGTEGSLQTSTPAIRASIPIGQPRIYYGEITDTYVMTGTKTQELDYPSGAENVYNIYDGRGGIAIGGIKNLWRRLLFAQYLKDWQMLFTQNFTTDTKLLFRRNIRQRVQAIAPFLRYDRDPYLVSARGTGTNTKGEPTYLYWILDAYTTSDRYPYSDPGKNKFNYIRNSVKVVIDAYNGTVSFYVADPTDPIIKTFEAIFPNLFQPLEAMPITLRNHIRYPVDLFSIQSERLLTYHMTDPQVFYNREDLWRIPTEIYGSESRPVEPYYLIMKLPTAESEEFILLLPFTPVQRVNLIAWLAARSDGAEYGKLLLYQFPKQELVYGIQQIEALINQDPEISQRITLWNREGSRVIQGNLLVIPIEESLLYVEPIYLEAEKNSLPTLVRVIVAYENRIVMAETLSEALNATFQPKKNLQPAIVRPLQQ
ncbi:MAG: UPF0182 family protein [Nostocaceae cyanobacterium]|nr:UPF0182 family protein [Nostocaceae cyanobacterium]